MTKNDELFLQLITIFQASALQGMGKLKNPVTDKTEVNHEHATHSINMLDMLKEKTAGNISNDLLQILNKVISELKLNYTDIKNN